MHHIPTLISLVVIQLVCCAGCLATGEAPGKALTYPTNLDQLSYESSHDDIPYDSQLMLKVQDNDHKDSPLIATLEFQIWSSHYGTKVFNPYSRPLIPASYNIAVFDDKKQHVGNILPVFSAGSRRLVSPGDWVSIQGDCGTCYRIPLRIARVSRPWKGDKVPLNPGRYELQVVANSMLFEKVPVNSDGRYDENAALEWPHQRVNADAWRSNRVTIEIKPSDPVMPPPPPEKKRDIPEQ